MIDAVPIIAIESPAVSSMQAVGEAPLTLTRGHPPVPGDMILLMVTLGPIGHQRVDILDVDGTLIGSLSPFGPTAATAGGMYFVPVQPDRLRDGKLVVTFALVAGGVRHAPQPGDIPAVELLVVTP